MAQTSIFNLVAGTSLATGDVLPFVDISDLTQSAHGSLLKITMTNFFATVPAPVIVTSTSTQLQLKYDGANHLTVAVSSAGAVTLNATGASAGFTFADGATFTAGAGFGGALDTNYFIRCYGTTRTDGQILSGMTSGALIVGLLGTTGAMYGQLQNTSGIITWGVEASTGGAIFTGTTAYATVFGTNAAKPIQFCTNNTVALTLASGGAATFASTVATVAPSGGAGVWKLGVANVVSPTSPNRTITVEIDGTLYYLAAKTTNN